MVNELSQNIPDQIDDDDDAPIRVGRRIRKIREARNLTLSQAAERIGTSAEMLQRYETGQRKPKKGRLEEIASALGVSSMALSDPVLSNCYGAMYALFELEEKYNLTLYKENGEIYMMFPGGVSQTMNVFLNKWYEMKIRHKAQLDVASEEEKDILKKVYYDWEWSFPNSIIQKPARSDIEKEIEVLEKRLKELKDALRNDDTDNDVNDPNRPNGSNNSSYVRVAVGRDGSTSYI